MRIFNTENLLIEHINDYRVYDRSLEIPKFDYPKFGDKIIFQEVKGNSISKPRVGIYHFTGMLDMAIEHNIIEKFKNYYYNFSYRYLFGNNPSFYENDYIDHFKSTSVICWSDDIIIYPFSIEKFKELYREHIRKEKN